jgi:hypothetical protein
MNDNEILWKEWNRLSDLKFKLKKLGVDPLVRRNMLKKSINFIELNK